MTQITVIVPLDTPIIRGETTISSVTLRKPDAGALRGTKLADVLQMDVSALTIILPRITDPFLTTADINQMDPADLVAMGSEVATFLLPKAAKG